MSFQFSAVRNQLLRMYGVCRLHSLHTLNLSYNGILTIEGLKELVSLKWLCLGGNSIKVWQMCLHNWVFEYFNFSVNILFVISWTIATFHLKLLVIGDTLVFQSFLRKYETTIAHVLYEHLMDSTQLKVSFSIARIFKIFQKTYNLLSSQLFNWSIS